MRKFGTFFCATRYNDRSSVTQRATIITYEYKTFEVTVRLHRSTEHWMGTIFRTTPATRCVKIAPRHASD